MEKEIRPESTRDGGGTRGVGVWGSRECSGRGGEGSQKVQISVISKC